MVKQEKRADCTSITTREHRYLITWPKAAQSKRLGLPLRGEPHKSVYRTVLYLRSRTKELNHQPVLYGNRAQGRRSFSPKELFGPR